MDDNMKHSLKQITSNSKYELKSALTIPFYRIFNHMLFAKVFDQEEIHQSPEHFTSFSAF